MKSSRKSSIEPSRAALSSRSAFSFLKRLASYFGMSEGFWLGLQRDYETHDLPPWPERNQPPAQEREDPFPTFTEWSGDADTHLAQQLADNIANDATTRSQLDETQIPEPLASVLRACIVRRRRQALHNARVWRDVLYALTPKES